MNRRELAELIADHGEMYDADGYHGCDCGLECSAAEHAEHLADVVLRATTPVADHLADFLLARIAEDEKRTPLPLGDIRQRASECEAKRKIVEDYLHLTARGPGALTAHAYWVCRALALPYSGHPDYRQEWAA